MLCFSIRTCMMSLLFSKALHKRPHIRLSSCSCTSGTCTMFNSCLLRCYQKTAAHPPMHNTHARTFRPSLLTRWYLIGCSISRSTLARFRSFLPRRHQNRPAHPPIHRTHARASRPSLNSLQPIGPWTVFAKMSCLARDESLVLVFTFYEKIVCLEENASLTRFD